MTKYSPFADWLDVTYSPDDFPLVDIESFLLAHGFTSRPIEKGYLWFPPSDYHGALKVSENRQHCRVSASGGVVDSMRSMSIYDDYLMLLAGSPCRVTRLDIAVDLDIDFPDWFEDFTRRYGKVSSFKLFRNHLPVKYLLEYRDSDSRASGTLYFGHRTRARYTARIYDKQAEAMANHCFSLPPTTRVEITVREGNATLRDASRPAALFWEVMGRNAILDAPNDIPSRVMIDLSPSYPKRISKLPYQAIRDGVQSDPQLQALLRVADTIPNGRDYLLSELQRLLRSDSAGLGHKAS